MSLQIKTIDLVKEEGMYDRDVELNGNHVQSVNIYQTDGSFVTSEPFNNKLIWYPQNPNNVANTALGEWKEFTSFAGYGFLNMPMDARFDYARRILWIADSGNKRVLKVDINSETVLDVAENNYFCHSLAANINTGGVFVKSIKDANTGIIQHYNSKVSLQRDFEFACDYPFDTDNLVWSCDFALDFPLPFSMVYDHVRNRLWWLGNETVYMVDLTNKNIVPYSMASYGYNELRSIDVDFESGNVFIIVKRKGLPSWYVLQIFRDNNFIVSTAYIEKVEDSNGPCFPNRVMGNSDPDSLCSLSLNTSGGDEGYYREWDVTSESAIEAFYLNIDDFTTYYIKDQLVIGVDGVTLYDSGCIRTSSTGVISGVSILIPQGSQQVSVRVIPLCDGSPSGTAWKLRLSCKDA